MDPNQHQLPYYHQHQPYDYYADLEPPPSMTINSQQNGGTPDVPTAVQNLLLSTKSLQSSSHSGPSPARPMPLYPTFTSRSARPSMPRYARSPRCLAEEPSEEVLALYMPQVRKVIWKLLKGLQARQEVWRRFNGGG
ncbi:hypothetical protein BDZ89DRAFT_1072546 [Hymenopellis radicata]|nr:hypothetical protein BDZ89DRAFT_1072546 [Hymenopellis radicata]